MARVHPYQKHVTPKDLKKLVWEGLNRPGRPIDKIDSNLYNPIHDETRDKPIWHNKTGLDRFVMGELGLRLEDYGAKRSNYFYKSIANEIGKLRAAGILIDWKQVKKSRTGMGVWRLDKTKLGSYVYEKASQEMKNRDFHSRGSECMVFVREKQNAFRRELILEYGKCAMCGFEIREYMIGAHIVPYKIMSVEDAGNAMNPSNGLLLCRLCDVAFENGSIRISEDLGVTILEHLSDQRSSVVRSWLDLIPGELHIRDGARYPPDPKYLRWKIDLLQKQSTTR